MSSTSPESLPAREQLHPTSIVIDSDTSVIDSDTSSPESWRERYKQYCQDHSVRHVTVNEFSDFRRLIINLVENTIAVTAIILSGRKIISGEQSSWLQFVAIQGLKSKIVAITDYQPNSPEWRQVAEQYGVKQLYKDPSTFSADFQNLLEEVVG